jgi:hypothetical protein
LGLDDCNLQDVAAECACHSRMQMNDCKLRIDSKSRCQGSSDRQFQKDNYSEEHVRHGGYLRLRTWAEHARLMQGVLVMVSRVVLMMLFSKTGHIGASTVNITHQSSVILTQKVCSCKVLAVRNINDRTSSIWAETHGHLVALIHLQVFSMLGKQ